MKKKKIAIIGAGNAGVATALHYYYYGRDLFDKITIYHDSSIPIERVGQGSLLDFASLLSKIFDFNLYNKNLINATRKDGFLYKDWGKKQDEIYHAFFPSTNTAIHYVPKLLSDLLLECGLFEIVEKKIINPEEEVDAEFIFDCRGKHDRDQNLYDSLINPLNHVLLIDTEEPDPSLTFTKCVATPDGWTFMIPNQNSVSYGYLFNHNVTNLDQAKKNFFDLFNLRPDGEFSFSNYIAKEGFVENKTFLNGNRLCFLEPLEATSVSFYLKVARFWWDHIVDGVDKTICNQNIRNEMNKLQTFVLWHYQKGSKYNTPFWDYAKSLPFVSDREFVEALDFCKKNNLFECKNATINGLHHYGQWTPYSFKIWDENV